jgi:aminopeptidase N
LRFYLGDTLFFETLKAFIDEFAFNHASSYDMRDFMSTYTGIDMNGFFNNYVLKSGTPLYSIDSFKVIMKDVNKFETTVYVKQKRNGPEYIGDGNIMEVTFMDDKWNNFTDTIHFDGQTGSSLKTLTFRPTIILVDLEEKMCDATIDNYKKVIKTGNIVFGSTFFSLDVKSIVDSAFIQVTHNWAPPDSLKTPYERLRLSDCRYWRIDGIFPVGMQATGKFNYNNIDNTLITSSTDSVIILYRKGTFDDWHELEFEKNGTWKSGNILVNNLKAGEYVLAVREPGVGIYDSILPKINTLEIFPNPSTRSIQFISPSESSKNGKVLLYDYTGRLVFTQNYPFLQAGETVSLELGEQTRGIYLLRLKIGNEEYSGRVVLVK